MTLMARRTVLTSVAALLVAHFALLFLFPAAQAASRLVVLACGISAAAACAWRSTRSSGPVRRKWDFLASALSLWSIGEFLAFLRVLNPALGHIRALGPEFYFLIYGIPVLLAISSSNEDRDTSLFVAIDSLQALFAVALVYLELSMSELGTNPSIGATNLPVFYGIGSWMLAAAVLLRTIARPLGEERALYRILLVYLSFFALLATPWHGSCVLNLLPLGVYRDLLADLAFLLLTTGCLLYDLSPDVERPPVETNSFALVLNNGSPILFTLAVLALGAMVARRHLALGMSVIGLSLMTYCFRAALLQSAYIRAQHALTRSSPSAKQMPSCANSPCMTPSPGCQTVANSTSPWKRSGAGQSATIGHSRCCCSMWTASRRSMTAMAIRPETTACNVSLELCKDRCAAPRKPPHATAAKSSPRFCPMLTPTAPSWSRRPCARMCSPFRYCTKVLRSRGSSPSASAWPQLIPPPKDRRQISSPPPMPPYIARSNRGGIAWKSGKPPHPALASRRE
jgi:hypothetical protein